MSVGESLKNFRKGLNLTQKQAAESAGVSNRVYQYYEYDKVVPPVTAVIKLADAYNVSIDYLVGRSDNPQRL